MNRSIESYTDLLVWQRAMDLVDSVYAATRSFPKSEQFGLTAQVRRAVVSIPSNIAEGWGRPSRKDFLRFLYIARGSLYEVETQLRIAKRQGFLHDDDLTGMLSQAETLSKMLLGLTRSLEKRRATA
ncbi:MAG: four helix bundle protein [Bacteroidota bacterium]